MFALFSSFSTVPEIYLKTPSIRMTFSILLQARPQPLGKFSASGYRFVLLLGIDLADCLHHTGFRHCDMGLLIYHTSIPSYTEL